MFILDINLVSDRWFENILSDSVGSLLGLWFIFVLFCFFPFCPEAFKFYIVQFIYFCFFWPVILVSNPRSHCHDKCLEAFPLFFLL